jgi:hypothetical protein
MFNNFENQNNVAEEKNTEPSFLKEVDLDKKKTIYGFENKVGVVFDESGKNYSKLPEIIFGVVDSNGNKGIDQPPKENRDETIDMNFVVECIRKAASDFGQNKFWFYPNNNDGKGAARARIFSRYVNLKEDEDNHGYIIEI